MQENEKAGSKPAAGAKSAAGAKAAKAKPTAGAKKGARGKDSGKKGANEKRPSEVEPPAPDSSKPEVCGMLNTAISSVSAENHGGRLAGIDHEYMIAVVGGTLQ